MIRSIAAIGLLVAGGLVAPSCGDGAPSATGAPDPIDTLREEAEPPSTLRVGISPGAGSPDTAERAAPFVEYLHRRLRMPVRLEVTTDYDGLAELVRRGEVDVAVFSPLAYVKARRELPLVPIATASRGGSPTYLGYFVVAESAAGDRLEDYRGARIAWVDRASTSGYLYARAALRARGHDPDRYFGPQVFAGDHLSAIRMVARGEVDVAAVSSSFVDLGGVERIPEADQIRVIAKTARIPFDCVVVHDSMPRPLARRVRDVLLYLDGDRRASEALASTWGISAFVRADDRRYDPIADVLQAD